ncbi:ADP-ribosylation factor 6 [Ogataea parapolymorpha DL-1]|uniref:ADP-ribosylation factor 6 n=1 Tax=Ogataea parapolymorpha (strain ATCC 26012 / BCRC 20466 / JCM 22074 / NRRL Y-7560 / DL-1) TaxID=871575 RepID=W1Q6U5_OGAPD|nr:ADP-ribosylation factor 6 [Ogataea parapolymorpha DL-1]ESW95893.1 ADP-ribosylation factor 6 [Ogataea parapolymorpha DL-1]
MGNSFSRLLRRRNKEVRMVMLGLDNSGKTTILYKLKLGHTQQTVPTVGFNVETIKYRNLVMNTWDVGGQERIRALWRHYFSGTDALIFVIDSADRSRLEEAKKELYKVINDRELTGCLLCVLANKQDKPGKMEQAELVKFLELESIKNHNWCIIPTVATDGTGLNQVLNWIQHNLN